MKKTVIGRWSILARLNFQWKDESRLERGRISSIVEIDKFVRSHEWQPGSFVPWNVSVPRSLKLSRLVSMNSGGESTLIDGGWIQPVDSKYSISVLALLRVNRPYRLATIRASTNKSLRCYPYDAINTWKIIFTSSRCAWKFVPEGLTDRKIKYGELIGIDRSERRWKNWKEIEAWETVGKWALSWKHWKWGNGKR